MTWISSVSPDIVESINEKLDNTVPITIMCLVQMEVKSDKYEPRVLAFSACRLFIFVAKVPTRVEHQFHYLEIQLMESKSPQQLILMANEKKFSFRVSDDRQGDIDAMIINFGVSIKNIFPGVPLSRIVPRLEVEPVGRVSRLHDLCRLVEARDPGPCGGFSHQYACMCDFLTQPYREEVAWDVDNSYAPRECREMNLQDFEHLETRDIMAVVSALEHNTWFTGVRLSHVKCPPEVLDRLCHVLRGSLCLQRLLINSTSIKADSVLKICNAIAQNSASALHTIDLSNNAIEDRGVGHLAQLLAQPNSCQLQQLLLNSCSLTARGVAQLCQALTAISTANNSSSSSAGGGSNTSGSGGDAPSSSVSATSAASTLTNLQLSGNVLRPDDSSAPLAALLSKTVALERLALSSCHLVIGPLFVSLPNCTRLTHLDLSGNFLLCKKSKEVSPCFQQLFATASSLKYINLSGCRLNGEALNVLLSGLSSNELLSEVSLDISGNALSDTGVGALVSQVDTVTCLHTLNISDIGADAALPAIISAVARCRALRSLNVSSSTGPAKTKINRAFMEALTMWLQDDECLLETLIVCDWKMKQDIHPLFDVLGANASLKCLDISGNLMGDNGVRLLGKALQINVTLRELRLDRNLISVQGLSELSYSLHSNYTLRHIAAPLADLVTMAKSSWERCDILWRTVESRLRRNNAAAAAAAPGGVSPAGAPLSSWSKENVVWNDSRHSMSRLVSLIRTHSGDYHRPTPPTPSTTTPSTTTTTASVIGSVAAAAAAAASGGDSCREASATPACPADPLKRALQLCDEAERCRQFFANWRLSAAGGGGAAGADAGGAGAAGGAAADAGISESDSSCRHQRQLETVLDELQTCLTDQLKECVTSVLSSASSLSSTLLSPSACQQIELQCTERAGAAVDRYCRQLQPQLSDWRLATTRHVLGLATDRIVATLNGAWHSLSPSTPSQWDDIAGTNSATERRKSLNSGSVNDAPTSTDPLVTPVKRSLFRKIRPKSSAVSVPFGWNFIPLSLSLSPVLPSAGERLTPVQEGGSVSDSPPPQLQHLVKGRPRRPKKSAPTRAALDVGAESAVSAGVADFFTTGGGGGNNNNSGSGGAKSRDTPMLSFDLQADSKRVLPSRSLSGRSTTSGGSAGNSPSAGARCGLKHSPSAPSADKAEAVAESSRERVGVLRKGISSVFGKLSTGRSGSSRSDKNSSRKSFRSYSSNTQLSATSSESSVGGDTNFLNHLLTPASSAPVAPPTAGGATSTSASSCDDVRHSPPPSPSLADPTHEPASPGPQSKQGDKIKDDEEISTASTAGGGGGGGDVVTVANLSARIAKLQPPAPSLGLRASPADRRRSGRPTSELQACDDSSEDGARSLPSVYVAAERRSRSPVKLAPPQSSGGGGDDKSGISGVIVSEKVIDV